MAFGASATAHGFPVASHANDCADCDNRMARVKPQESNSDERKIYDGSWLSFPRSSDISRSPIYVTHQNSPSTEPIGTIPNSAPTFASWESSYPLINEHGLAFGESTTNAKVVLAAAGINHEYPNKTRGSAMFAISSLMAVALERCKTARCAITTMGQLAERFGFFGESFGASEALAIIDKNEAWIFEITGDGSAIGALWAAQRVPGDHVAVLANSMIIGDIDFDSPDFITSTNLINKTTELGLYHGGVFNWRKTLSADAGQPLYAALRMWRVFSQVSSFKLPVPKPGEFADYPFSVKVDAPLSIEQIFNLHRDHYEGTEFDMTQGVMAGPWGNPNYEFTGLEFRQVPGQAPRAISIMRTSYCQVATSGSLAKVWYAADAPATSVFVPFYAIADDYSDTFGSSQGPSLKKFDRTSAFWAFDFVANWMGLNYRNMSIEMVYPARDELQAFVMGEAAKAEKEAVEAPGEAREILGRAQTIIQSHVVQKWWELADDLIVRYNDGLFNFGEAQPQSAGALPYPSWWLRMIGFNADFYKPGHHWVMPAGPEAFAAASRGFQPSPPPQSVIPYFVIFALAPIFFILGFRQGKVKRKGDLSESLIL